MSSGKRDFICPPNISTYLLREKMHLCTFGFQIKGLVQDPEAKDGP